MSTNQSTKFTPGPWMATELGEVSHEYFVEKEPKKELVT